MLPDWIDLEILILISLIFHNFRGGENYHKILTDGFLAEERSTVMLAYIWGKTVCYNLNDWTNYEYAFESLFKFS